jgi:hypothetical protein
VPTPGILSVDHARRDRQFDLALGDFCILFSPRGEPAPQVVAAARVAICRFVRKCDRDRQNGSNLSIGGAAEPGNSSRTALGDRQNGVSFCSILSIWAGLGLLIVHFRKRAKTQRGKER